MTSPKKRGRSLPFLLASSQAKDPRCLSYGVAKAIPYRHGRPYKRRSQEATGKDNDFLVEGSGICDGGRQS
jgi:hypothetical protein